MEGMYANNAGAIVCPCQCKNLLINKTVLNYYFVKIALDIGIAA